MCAIGDVYPGTKICFIMNPFGEVEVDGSTTADGSTDATNHDDARAVVGALKQALIQFVDAVGDTCIDCPVIHIKGVNHIFSCYDIGAEAKPGCLLAFYSEMHDTSVEMFDTTEADAAMVPITESIKHLLNMGARVVSRGRRGSKPSIID